MEIKDHALGRSYIVKSETRVNGLPVDIMLEVVQYRHGGIEARLTVNGERIKYAGEVTRFNEVEGRVWTEEKIAEMRENIMSALLELEAGIARNRDIYGELVDLLGEPVVAALTNDNSWYPLYNSYALMAVDKKTPVALRFKKYFKGAIVILYYLPDVDRIDATILYVGGASNDLENAKIMGHVNRALPLLKDALADILVK